MAEEEGSLAVEEDSLPGGSTEEAVRHSSVVAQR